MNRTLLETRNTSTQERRLTSFQTLETGERRPACIRVLPHEIPDALRSRPQWAIWRATWRIDQRTGQGKWTKPPLDARTGRPASVQDPRTWSTFAQALEGMTRMNADGIGFVFASEDPFGCVDLDTMDDETRAIVAELASYSEWSPSQRGVHIIVRTTKPAGGCRRGPIEMYDRSRFLTITGHRLPGTPAAIEERQAAYAAVHQRLFPPPQHSPLRRPVSSLATGDAVERLTRMFGAAFTRLWRGDLSDVSGDASRGDYRLCWYLTRVLGTDAQEVDRLFRQSALYRPKWDRPDRSYGSYGLRTIHAAAAR